MICKIIFTFFFVTQCGPDNYINCIVANNEAIGYTKKNEFMKPHTAPLSVPGPASGEGLDRKEAWRISTLSNNL